MIPGLLFFALIIFLLELLAALREFWPWLLGISVLIALWLFWLLRRNQ